jgi:hypothetical protein
MAAAVALPKDVVLRTVLRMAQRTDLRIRLLLPPLRLNKEPKRDPSMTEGSLFLLGTISKQPEKDWRGTRGTRKSR